jgi:hypothetical protein
VSWRGCAPPAAASSSSLGATGGLVWGTLGVLLVRCAEGQGLSLVPFLVFPVTTKQHGKLTWHPQQLPRRACHPTTPFPSPRPSPLPACSACLPTRVRCLPAPRCRVLAPGEAALKPEEASLLDRICEAYYLPAWCSIADYEGLFKEAGITGGWRGWSVCHAVSCRAGQGRAGEVGQVGAVQCSA